ncbi:MAG: PEP/pyruvate-binding domain-containing protein [Micrococcaceae bacterium]
MLISLSDASRDSAGGKASVLAALLRKGFPVPDGFVVSNVDLRTAARIPMLEAVSRQLKRLGDPVVAVRSSGMSEDMAEASAAGQYESVIGVRGAESVCQAIDACQASVEATRVGAYWNQQGTDHHDDPGMAVLVQPMIEADVSGVMFTRTQPDGPTRIEASWGLGLAVVGGHITPDSYDVASDGSLSFSPGSKHLRIDLDDEHEGVMTSAVSPDQQSARTLDDATVRTLAGLGERIADLLGAPQDIEWAVAQDVVWILQARPITVALPSGQLSAPDSSPSAALTGTPGSNGIVTARARIVRGFSDFAAVRRGEIVVCPYTDPAWTPLFTIAAGVVTETGGALSHAAIVAREYGIPAVLGAHGAMSRIENGARVTLDGSTGTVVVH